MSQAFQHTCLAVSLLLAVSVRAAVAGEPPGNDGNRPAKPPRLVARLGDPRFQQEGGLAFPVASVALAPDGKVLATVHFDGTIRLWETASGKERGHISGLESVDARIAFTPDGTGIFAEDRQRNTIRRWDLAAKRELPPLALPPEDAVTRVYDAAGALRMLDGFNPIFLALKAVTAADLEEIRRLVRYVPPLVSGQRTILVSPGDFRIIRVRDGSTGRLTKLAGHTGRVTALAVSADGAVLASGSEDLSIRLWDLATGKELRRLVGHRRAIRLLGFSPDRRFLASGDWWDSLRLWDALTGQERPPLEGFPRHCDSPTFSADGKLLVVSCHDHVRVWNTDTGKEHLPAAYHHTAITSVSYTPDSRTAFTVDEDGTVLQWDPYLGVLRRRFPPLGFGYWVAAVALDGRTLASAGPDGVVHLVDVATGRVRLHCGRPLPPVGEKAEFGVWELYGERHPRAVGHLLFSPDSKAVAAVLRAEGSLVVWHAETGKELLRRRLDRLDQGPHFTTHVGCVTFSPDSRAVAVAWDTGFHNGGKTGYWFEGTGAIRQWDLASGKEVLRVTTKGESVEGLTMARDGRSLRAAGYSHAFVRIYDVPTGRSRFQLASEPQAGFGDGSDHHLRDAQLSPDGQVLLITEDLIGKPGTRFRFLHAPTGKETAQVSLKERMGTAIFSPDGRTVVIADGDTLYLWEVATGQPVLKLSIREHLLKSVTFSPDGRLLLSTGFDTATVWDLTGRVKDGALQPAQLRPAELDAVWSDLAHRDAAKAWDAIWTLAAAPQSASFIGERLVPAVRVPADRVARWLRDLDSSRFAVRQKATESLRELRERAVPHLRAALAVKPSPEVRQRLEQLLRHAEEPASSPEDFRRLRALQVLEYSATPAARQVLKGFAGGDPAAALTRDASAVLVRLGPGP